MSESGFRRSTSIALGIAGRGLRILFTTPAVFLPSMIFPVFFLIGFAGALSRLVGIPGFDFSGGYTSFIYPFVLLQAVAFGGVFTGFAIARDFESGFARRLLLAAPDRRAIVAGYVLVAMTRGLFSAAVVTIAATVGGIEMSGTLVSIVGMVTLALLVNLSATLWGAGVALRLRTMQAGALMQMPVFLILFFAPVYVPYDLLQGWIKAVASVNPITQVLEALRDFISGASFDSLLAYALMCALVLLFLWWALRGLRKAEANA